MNNDFLDIVYRNNLMLDPTAVKRVLVIYDDDSFFLGDNCIILYKLGLCRHFFGANAVMDVNFVASAYLEKYRDLCRHNPNFDQLVCLPADQVDYDRYDIIVCICLDEMPLLKGLERKYRDMSPPRFAVFSFSQIVFMRKENVQLPVFPFYEALFDYTAAINDKPCELYVSAAERQWGNRWLEDRGIKTGEELYIIVDNASDKDKLISLDTYYHFLLHVLNRPHTKILIFDERNLGKETFYRAWLGEEKADRFIFSNGLSLREDLCIIAADYTTLVFGPCTGLLHCASGICNNAIRNGVSPLNLPAIIVYTGNWDADFWWGKSPLVECLLLRKADGQKQLAVLNELAAAERVFVKGERLDCREYTADMLNEYLDKRLPGHRNAAAYKREDRPFHEYKT